MLLVDSSIWVLVEHGHLEITAIDEDLAISPAVALEVLRGVSSARHDFVRGLLLGAQQLDDPMPFARFEEAAKLYRRCRSAGVTVRSSIDCLVAATAIAHGVPVFHDDRDFEQIKRVVPLRTVTRSSAAEHS